MEYEQKQAHERHQQQENNGKLAVLEESLAISEQYNNTFQGACSDSGTQLNISGLELAKSYSGECGETIDPNKHT